MFRKVSTLLVLATFLAIGGCDDEIITDAIPVSDAASDHAGEASKDGGDTASDAAQADAAGDGGTPSSKDGSTTGESAPPDGGANPEAGTTSDGAASDAAVAVTDAPPG